MNDFERKAATEYRKEEPLEIFRNKIRDLVVTEKERGNAGHFSDLFDPEQLDEEDMSLYSNYKSHQLDVEELQRSAMALKGSNNGSKKDFISYLINRIQEDMLGGR